MLQFLEAGNIPFHNIKNNTGDIKHYFESYDKITSYSKREIFQKFKVQCALIFSQF